MAKADPELRFKVIELAMKQATYKIDTAFETAERILDFVETETKSGGQPEAPKKRGRPPKTAGKTAEQSAKAPE